MEYIKNKDFLQYVKNIISEKHQIKSHELHLTVSKIFEIHNKGSIDFGGSEEKKSQIPQLEPYKKNPKDKYGWWELEQGLYYVKINEKISIKENQLGIITPLKRTIDAGAIINTEIITKNDTNDLKLSFFAFNGIDVKENARIAKLFILES